MGNGEIVSFSLSAQALSDPSDRPQPAIAGPPAQSSRPDLLRRSCLCFLFQYLYPTKARARTARTPATLMAAMTPVLRGDPESVDLFVLASAALLATAEVLLLWLVVVVAEVEMEVDFELL